MLRELIWTKAQLQKLDELRKEHRIPQYVIDEVKRVVRILDCYYGEKRDVDDDDGGYVCLISSENIGEVRKEYLKILKQYNLEKDMAEFEDILCSDGEIEWHSDLFLVCNDYGVTIIYPVEGGEQDL